MTTLHMNSDKHLLLPFGQARHASDLEAIWTDKTHQSTQAFEAQFTEASTLDAFEVPGFCLCCDLHTKFAVDLEWGGRKVGNKLYPNWRERMVCTSCQMNNRQRLMATLLKQFLNEKVNQSVYLMEQVTPIFDWAEKHCIGQTINGSEYLGPGYASGTIIEGIRHEDIENLSFGSQTLDLVVSNDVFEHVPDYQNAFAECARVLKPGGIMLATIPFHSQSIQSVVRAKLSEGQINHLQPPQYHGNPVSQEGSLVFTDFGWDVKVAAQNAGFQEVTIDYYLSEPYGHLGEPLGVFRFQS